MIPPGTEVFFLIITACCVFAVWRGGGPERTAALAVYLAWIASNMLNTLDFARPQLGMMVVDIVLLVVLVAMALISGRIWLKVAAALQALTTAGHVAMLLDMRIHSYAYQTAMVVWGYGVLLCLVIGAELAARRRKAEKARIAGR